LQSRPSWTRIREGLSREHLRGVFTWPRFKRGVGRLSFFLPALVLIGIFIAFPIYTTLILSFFPEGGGDPTLDNYATVLTHRDTLNLANIPGPPPYGTLINNAIWIAIHLPLTLFTGLALAIILRGVRGASFVKSIVFIGMVTPMIVGGFILRFLYEQDVGLVPSFFEFIGVEGLATNWIARPTTLLYGLIFGSVWMWMGFSLIVYSAGLTTIPREYFEAAKIDGASSWRTFSRITFPLLKPMTLVIVTMTILWELKLFDIVIAATNASGGVGQAADVLALQMFRYFFRDGDLHLAAAVATIMTGLTLVAVVFLVRRLVTR
jgi:multiple sugar transport system permease protein